MPKKWTILTICVFLLGLPLRALDPERAVTQYIIEKWDVQAGLPQSSVHAIIQTHDGYLWLGTEEGLARFNGLTFSIFDSVNTPALTSNYIQCLYEDRQNNLWIGTLGGGFLRYREGEFKSYTQKDGLSSNTVYCIHEDSSHYLWLGTDGGGLNRWDETTNSFTVYREKDGLPDNMVRAIYEDSQGNLWIGTRAGLCRRRNNTFISCVNGTGAEFFQTISEDSEHNLWISSTLGLYRWEKEKLISYPIPTVPSSNKIRKIFVDSDKNIWIATEEGGLIRYHNGAFSTLTQQDGLLANVVLALAEDREGNLWIGTAFGGLNCLKEGKFVTLTTREGLSDDVVFSVYEDSKGYLWFGTNNGLNRYKNGKFKYFTAKDGLTDNIVDTIFEDRSGLIWVGTDSGLNLLKSSQNRIIKLADYLRAEYIPAIMEDRAGNIRVGTLKGSVTIRNRKIARWLKQKDGLGTDCVTLIHEDRGGSIWFCTLRGGITRYKDGQYRVFTTADGLVADTVQCIHEDAEGVLWMGTNDGLCRWQEGKTTNFTRRNGLFHNNIYQILEDRQGKLWMSTNKGIFTVSKKELTSFAESRIHQITSVVYDQDDGMKSSECNGGYQSAGYRARDGKLWFPTVKGVVVVDPGHITINRVPAPVLIERVLLDGKPFQPLPHQTVVVQPGVKHLEIQAIALSFVNPTMNRFKYKLQGYDHQWFDAGQQRSVGYTNLDAGTYRFSVIASNNDGVWNEQGASLALRVIPPLWKTWWFQVAALILFAIASYLVIHLTRKYLTLTRFWKKEKYVGNYKIVEKIGAGGMGTVYKAHSLTDKKETVALKVLREEMFSDESSRKRFKQEATIIDQLDHPHIIKILERGETRHNMFIAMEYLQGITLARKIEKEKRLDIKEALHIMIQTAAALAKIHSKTIIHRDLKPDNIMLVERDNDPNFVKLLDFGLAKTQYQTRLTQTGIVIGTINYISPEQISGDGSSAASDIYALGTLFYEMVTGEKPFIGETTIDIMKQIMDKEPIEPGRFRDDIPRRLNHLILRMLDKKITSRPVIDEVLAHLKHIAANLGE